MRTLSFILVLSLLSSIDCYAREKLGYVEAVRKLSEKIASEFAIAEDREISEAKAKERLERLTKKFFEEYTVQPPRGQNTEITPKQLAIPAIDSFLLTKKGSRFGPQPHIIGLYDFICELHDIHAIRLDPSKANLGRPLDLGPSELRAALESLRRFGDTLEKAQGNPKSEMQQKIDTLTQWLIASPREQQKVRSNPYVDKKELVTSDCGFESVR